MTKYIYYTKEGKFEIDKSHAIPWDELHSPNEETPAYIETTDSGTYKEWCFNGLQHRLTGPAVIFKNGDKWFYLKDQKYEFKEWIHNHPNIDIFLEANGYITNAQKAFWKLKNL